MSTNEPDNTYLKKKHSFKVHKHTFSLPTTQSFLSKPDYSNKWSYSDASTACHFSYICNLVDNTTFCFRIYHSTVVYTFTGNRWDHREEAASTGSSLPIYWMTTDGLHFQLQNSSLTPHLTDLYLPRLTPRNTPSLSMTLESDFTLFFVSRLAI